MYVASKFLEGFIGYTVPADGNCMSGSMEADELAVVDPRASIAPFDICAVVLDGYSLQMLKVYLGHKTLPNGGKVWAFGQLEPTEIRVIPDERVNVIHKVTAIRDRDGNERDAQPVSNRWLSFAAGNEPIESVNPDWTPADC